MEFGKTDDLNNLDLNLPDDPEQTIRVLKEGDRKNKKSEVFIGCAKWGRPDWVGKIYPKGTKAKDFLKAYANHFDAIELNATFYNRPDKDQYAGWAAIVGDNFRFSAKFPQYITHLKRLKDVDERTALFYDALAGFGSKVENLFLVLHPQFAPKQIGVLEDYLKVLPKHLPVFVEFRHPGWFEGKTTDEAFHLLEAYNIGSIITDAAGRRDVVHMRLTTPTAFIRFVGNSLHQSDYTRIDEWVARMKKWINSGIQSIYFYMHQHEELYSPQLCAYLIRKLNEEAGLDIKVPILIGEI
ncbi:MAG: DUF72 domain-containing protein [Bacteroidota bacterium]|nr:DUF72 domain-containing protein [Bacteroidota bacterium]